MLLGDWQVNKWGNVIYDEFVRPIERVVDFRTEISGIRPRDLRKGWNSFSSGILNILQIVARATHGTLPVCLALQ